MNIIIMKRTLKDFKDIITHIFLLQTQNITVIMFCFFHSVCVFMCAYYVDLNEDHVPFHLTLSAFTYHRHAPLQSLYTGVPTELCPGTWAKTTEQRGDDWMNPTAYLLRDWAYCFVFIFHIYLRTYCAIASAPPAFHRCSWLRSQSLWIFCDFCTISKSALLVHKALSVCEMF